MFFQKHPFSVVLAALVLFLASCAAPKSPTGGPVDTAPPVIIAEESTPNQQTNFKGDEITITFDEWFTIKDVATQLVISPLMPEQPVVKQKGKSIVITLPDSLLEETTYTLFRILNWRCTRFCQDERQCHQCGNTHPCRRRVGHAVSGRSR